MGAFFLIVLSFSSLLITLVISLLTSSSYNGEEAYMQGQIQNFWQQEILQGTKINIIKDKEFLRDSIEQSMITVCEVIREQAIKNGCYGNQILGWEFIGCNGVSQTTCNGTLQNVLAGSVSSTFSCSNAAAYGRYLLQQALSSFNFGNYSTGNFSYYVSYPVDTTDACGMTDFVKI